ncbi:MAG: hypothetical protein JXB88_02180 [Spirochaetales bacterium]|nr:hypothetical protein [Spirochaetales bacterium]
MSIKNVQIPNKVIQFFIEKCDKLSHIDSTNELIVEKSGIVDFFQAEKDLSEIKELLEISGLILKEPDRREYGDFQTNSDLAKQCIKKIKEECDKFDFILEPTCGKGSFILAALAELNEVKEIIGIEIYLPYIWETKFNILDYFLNNEVNVIPKISIIHANIFDFNFEALSKRTKLYKTLIIGNPPWVTNSELSSIDSKNLPQKNNFKKHKGFDAITGKGNFDIAEYIALLILNNFSTHNGFFGFLIKNSVIKNIVFDQKKNEYPIGSIKNYNIDSKKEFNVSVEASFFLTVLNSGPGYSCIEKNLYSRDYKTEFGWIENDFVYSINDYKSTSDIEGKSPFTWRQGLKHDCSSIMEFEHHKSQYINALNEIFELEEDLVFPLLKSSDLKTTKVDTYRKLTIVTQKKISDDTSYIRYLYPKTYKYLLSHKDIFDRRKSSIYRGKPPFSIFGIGDYSFAPFKVAVSGMYKSTHFSLIEPINNKPVMFDDTCYFIGFHDIVSAKIAHFLLNNEHTQLYLKSIIFPDSKRPITKDILMRLDFYKMYKRMSCSNFINEQQEIEHDSWENFGNLVKGEDLLHAQLSLF